MKSQTYIEFYINFISMYIYVNIWKSWKSIFVFLQSMKLNAFMRDDAKYLDYVDLIAALSFVLGRLYWRCTSTMKYLGGGGLELQYR